MGNVIAKSYQLNTMILSDILKDLNEHDTIEKQDSQIPSAGFLAIYF